MAEDFQIVGPDVRHARTAVDVQQHAADEGLMAVNVHGQLAAQDADLAGHHPRNVDDLKLLPTAGRAVGGAGDIGGQRLSAPRVERSRQRDLGEELNPRPIGIDPNRGPQFVDHPRPPDVVGNQHGAAALADDLDPLGALSAVRPAANPLVGDERVLGIAAGLGPGGRGSFEILPPRRLPAAAAPVAPAE